MLLATTHESVGPVIIERDEESFQRNEKDSFLPSFLPASSLPLFPLEVSALGSIVQKYIFRRAWMRSKPKGSALRFSDCNKICMS